MDGGQQLVSRVFIKGHPLLEGAPRDHHARPENRISFPGKDRRRQLCQALRSVLPVAMEQSHGVETFFDGVMEANLLISAIALLGRVVEHGQRKTLALAARQSRFFEGLVLRRIVNDQDFAIVRGERGRYAGNHMLDGSRSIVGNDNDQQTFSALGKHDRFIAVHNAARLLEKAFVR